MRKFSKSIVLLLCFLLAAAVLPGAASAAGGYGVRVNGVAVNQTNAEDVLEDGTVSYAPETETLTLNGANLTVSYGAGIIPAVIYADETVDKLTILAQNDNGVSADGTSGIFAMNAIEFGGSGSLRVSAQSSNSEVSAVYSLLEGVTVTGGTHAFSGYGTTGYGVQVGYQKALTVTGGSMTAIGDGMYMGVSVSESLDFSGYTGCAVTASMNASGEPTTEYDPSALMYYRYVNIETPAPLVYDENGFTEDKKHFEPAELKDGWYEIKNAGNLYWFSQFLKQSDDNAAANVRLTRNITIPEDMNWLPMESGTYGIPYQGTFDGQGYAVRNLRTRYGAQDFYTGAGLFESIGKNGVVKNLRMENTDIDVTTGSAGSVCGDNFGLIENCYHTGRVRTASQWAGGIAGRNYGTIRHCHNSGTVFAQLGIAGGICGDALDYPSDTAVENAAVENCYNTGAVSAPYYVGGICGTVKQTAGIYNCYNTGEVTANTGYEYYARGIASYGSEPYPAQPDRIVNSYYLADSESADGGKTAAQFASGEVAYLLNGSVSTGDLVWGQTIGGAAAQDAPVFDGAVVYAGYAFCYSEDISYGNDAAALFDEKPQHDIAGGWKSDADGHWQVCQNDGCSATGEAQEHSPAAERVNAVEPTASKEGYTGDTVCAVCGRVLEYGSPIAKLAPVVTEGGKEYTPGKSEPLTFVSDAAVEDFIRVEIDGREISSENYTVTGDESQIRISLTPEYLATLSAGEHAVGIVSESGTAEMKFTVHPAPDASDNPQTGDFSGFGLLLALLLVGAGGVAAPMLAVKKHSAE